MSGHLSSLGARTAAAVFAILVGLVGAALPAASAAPTISPQSAAGRAIVVVGAADATATVHKPVRLGGATIRADGIWAFMTAKMQAPDGGRFSYVGTPDAEAAAHGGKSNTYDGLFRRTTRGWTRIDSAVGPTDVAWEGWAAKYGAPESIFH